MFHSITGTLSGKTSDTVYLSTGGIEWELSVSLQTLQSLPSLGQEIRLFCWLHHTEDQMRLYGFSTSLEKKIFLELIKVDGLGPRVALKVLSTLTPQQIQAALEVGDPQALSKAPGVGLKTAQKILLTLRGKLVLDETAAQPADRSWNDVIISLVDMGFDRKLVEEAIRAVAHEDELVNKPLEEKEKLLFKKALLWLSTH